MSDINIAAAIKARKQLEQTVFELKDRRATLAHELAGLRERNKALLDKPLSHADAKQFMFDVIDRRAAYFMERADWPAVFRGFAFPRPQPLYAPGPASAALSMRMVSQALEPAGIEGVESLLGVGACLSIITGAREGVAMASADRFYFLFADQIKAKVSEHFERCWPAYDTSKAAPEDSLAQRREEIAANEKRVAVIVEEMGEIDAKLDQIQPTL